jgi:uncharacterized protein (DUF2236 family)
MNQADDSDMQKDHQALRELAQIIDRYGGEPADWPPSAAAARQLLAQSSAARAALMNARRVDEWLGSLREHQAPAGLAAVPVLVGFLLGLGLPETGDMELTTQLGELAFIDLYQALHDAH